MLCSVTAKIAGAADLAIGRGGSTRPQSEQRLKGGHRLPTAVVAEHELVQVDLQLTFADPVIGAGQPLLEVANGPLCQGHHRRHAAPKFGAGRLGARDMPDAR